MACGNRKFRNGVNQIPAVRRNGARHVRDTILARWSATKTFALAQRTNSPRDPRCVMRLITARNRYPTVCADGTDFRKCAPMASGGDRRRINRLSLHCTFFAFGHERTWTSLFDFIYHPMALHRATVHSMRTAFNWEWSVISFAPYILVMKAFICGWWYGNWLYDSQRIASTPQKHVPFKRVMCSKRQKSDLMGGRLGLALLRCGCVCLCTPAVRECLFGGTRARCWPQWNYLCHLETQ